MEFSTKVGRPETLKTDAVVVGVHANGELSATAKALDTAAGGAIRAAIKSGDMTGKRGSTLLLRGLAGIASPRVLLVGLGGKDDFNEKAFAEAVRTGVKSLSAKNIALAAADWKVKGRDLEWQARSLVIAARETAFRTDELKSKRDADGSGAEQISLLLGKREAMAERAVRQGTAVANGMELTKRLGNLPGNICTPSYLAEQARALARELEHFPIEHCENRPRHAHGRCSEIDSPACTHRNTSFRFGRRTRIALASGPSSSASRSSGSRRACGPTPNGTARNSTHWWLRRQSRSTRTGRNCMRSWSSSSGL